MAKEGLVMPAIYGARSDRQQAAEKFDFLDEDKDGSLSMKEYLGGLESDPIGISKEDEEHVFHTLDEDKSDTLSRAEMAKERLVLSAELGGARSIAAENEFTVRDIDVDKDGFVSVKEFLSANLGESPSADAAQEMNEIYLSFKILDVDDNRKLSRAETARANLVMSAIERARQNGDKEQDQKDPEDTKGDEKAQATPKKAMKAGTEYAKREMKGTEKHAGT